MAGSSANIAAESSAASSQGAGAGGTTVAAGDTPTKQSKPSIRKRLLSVGSRKYSAEKAKTRKIAGSSTAQEPPEQVQGQASNERDSGRAGATDSQSSDPNLKGTSRNLNEKDVAATNDSVDPTSRPRTPPFYRRKSSKKQQAQQQQQSDGKSSTGSKRSFISRVVHKVVPCVGPSSYHPPSPPTQTSTSAFSGSAAATRSSTAAAASATAPIDNDLPLTDAPGVPAIPHDDATQAVDPDKEVVVPVPHLPQVDDPDGVTSGAVQPPGSTGEPPHQQQIVTRIVHSGSRRESRSDLDVEGEGEGTVVTTDDGESSKHRGDYEIQVGDEPSDDEMILEEDEMALEQRLVKMGGNGIPIGPDGKPKPLLPPILPQHAGRKCLVLDLDETLVHSSFKPVPNADFVVPVEIEYNWHHFHVLKRPGVDEFMRKMGEIYEIVVFTASLSKYADPVLDKLDIHNVVAHRLFRESCYSHRGNYVKDLSQLGRPISQTIILDNSPASYIFHPSNAVPVSSWFNDPHDAELSDLVPFLADLSDVPDVVQILDCKLGP